MRADGSPDLNSYLRFDVQGLTGNVTSATLRVYANSASSLGYDVYAVTEDTWTESTITYSNAPAMGTQLGSSGTFSAGTWTSVDVTSYITGNGVYNFAFSTTSSTNISFSSREGANAPQLVIETSSGPTNTPTATNTPGPTATASQTATLTPVGSNTPTVPPTAPPVFTSAQFAYDGDGKRVKSIINSAIITYFVGAHYEVSGSTVTKYYYAGAQRIAMRTNGTLSYLLGDHLGSTSLVTDAAGENGIETRYKAWGEVRYASGNMPTKYRYTGQFSYELEFGLMFYNARWYDSYITQFSQPDSIVPNLYNPQSLNRYSYVLNNPIRYNDPTGHKYCDGGGLGGECDQSGIPTSRGQLNRVLKASGVKLKGGWKYEEAYAAYLAVTAVGEKLARTLGGSAESAFRKVFKDGVNITMGGEGATGMCAKVTSGGCTSSDSQINFWSMSNDMVKNVVHELGHAFYKAAGNPMLLDYAFSRNALIRNKSYGGGEELVWEQHPISMNDPKEDIPTELFADTFIAWTYDAWNSDPDFALDVNNARNEMDRIASSVP